MIQNLEKRMTLQGFDVVAFFDGKAKKENEALSSNCEGAKDYFTSPKSFLIKEGKLDPCAMLFFGINKAKGQWVKKPAELQLLAVNKWIKFNS
jgi:hypothetical protein